MKCGGLNGFSQPSAAHAPTGTWENGVFDYDHLKKSYLPTYTRYWDSQSKVPYLFNASTGIWISYDDRESIRIKSDYIKREQLAGAMFWELSGDRNYELLGVTNDVFDSNEAPSPDCHPPTETKSVSVAASKYSSPPPAEKKVKSKFPAWQPSKEYGVGERVVYENRSYRCVRGHTSLPGWTPMVIRALWQPI